MIYKATTIKRYYKNLDYKTMSNKITKLINLYKNKLYPSSIPEEIHTTYVIKEDSTAFTIITLDMQEIHNKVSTNEYYHWLHEAHPHYYYIDTFIEKLIDGYPLLNEKDFENLNKIYKQLNEYNLIEGIKIDFIDDMDDFKKSASNQFPKIW